MTYSIHLVRIWDKFRNDIIKHGGLELKYLSYEFLILSYDTFYLKVINFEKIAIIEEFNLSFWKTQTTYIYIFDVNKSIT